MRHKERERIKVGSRECPERDAATASTAVPLLRMTPRGSKVL
jgi:hypothetical protein